MKVMILAAGKGTRMLPLTSNTPKPLLKVGGKTLIQHQIEKLAANGFNELVINYSWLGRQIEESLGDGSALGVSIQYSPEEEPLETAGGIIKALPLLGKDSFVVVNADIWTDYSFKNLPEVDGKESLAHLVLVNNAEHHPAGDFVLENSLINMPTDKESKTLTYSGVAVYHPDFFTGVTVEKYPLLPLLKRAMENSKLSGEHYQGQWIDVGTPARLEALDSQLSS